MTNNKKALFFDIDGTIHDNSIMGIRPSTVEVIHQLAKKTDIDMYISTGRSFAALRGLEAIIDCFKGFNLVNGEQVIINGQMVYNGQIDKNVVKRLFKYTTENAISIGIMTVNQLYVSFHDDYSRDNFEKYLKIPANILNDVDDITEDIVQIWIFLENNDLKKVEHAFPELDFVYWGNYGADVINKGASKGKGIEKICQAEGYQFINTYSFGDSYNDIKMFEKTNISVCMGNGQEQVKKCAKIIAPDISEDGLARIINDLNLLK